MSKFKHIISEMLESVSVDSNNQIQVIDQKRMDKVDSALSKIILEATQDWWNEETEDMKRMSKDVDVDEEVADDSHELEEDAGAKYTLSALGKKDKAVIKAFFNKEELEGTRLHTDGSRLDFYGLGGNKVAYWEDDKIAFRPTSGRVDQALIKTVKKMAQGEDVVLAECDELEEDLGSIYTLSALGKDKEVIKAFANKEALEGKRIKTDGESLDMLTMRGEDIAMWDGDEVVFRDPANDAEDALMVSIRSVLGINESEEIEVDYITEEELEDEVEDEATELEADEELDDEAAYEFDFSFLKKGNDE